VTVHVNIQDAKTNFSRLVARVEAGEHVVVARRGVPVVELSRVDQDAVGLGFWPGQVSDEAARPLDPQDLADWGAA